MSKTGLIEYANALPKAELHLHLEGTLEPEMLFELAQRNKVSIPFESVEAVQEAYNFRRLQDFLDIYYQGMAVLQTERDFYDLTYAYLKRVAADNVVHVEVFYDPQGHTERGLDFAVPITGILSALEDGRRDFNISAHIIMCFLRHLSEAAAFDTLAQAEPWLDKLKGVGLDSSELGHPPSKFENVFAAARSEGLQRVAHAGEEGPPDYVYQALDLLHIDRLDHGNRAMEDKALVERLVKSGMTLTVCPLSNQKLCVVDNMAVHPIKRMLDLGLKATVNSDDPAYFGGYVNDNFHAIIRHLDISAKDIRQLARNSFTGAFLDDATQEQFLAAIDTVAPPDS